MAAIIEQVERGEPVTLPVRDLTPEEVAGIRASQTNQLFEFVSDALNNSRDPGVRPKPNTLWFEVIGPTRREALSRETAAAIGRDVTYTGAVTLLDEDAVRHAINRHGSDKIPLRPEHLTEAAQTITEGEIARVDIGKHNEIGVTFRRKLEDGDWLYIQVAKRRNVLHFVTAYRTPGGRDAPESGPTQTPSNSAGQPAQPPRNTPSRPSDSDRGGLERGDAEGLTGDQSQSASAAGPAAGRPSLSGERHFPVIGVETAPDIAPNTRAGNASQVESTHPESTPPPDLDLQAQREALDLSIVDELRQAGRLPEDLAKVLDEADNDLATADQTARAFDAAGVCEASKL